MNKNLFTQDETTLINSLKALSGGGGTNSDGERDSDCGDYSRDEDVLSATGGYCKMRRQNSSRRLFNRKKQQSTTTMNSHVQTRSDDFQTSSRDSAGHANSKSSLASDWFVYAVGALQDVFAVVSCKKCSSDKIARVHRDDEDNCSNGIVREQTVDDDSVEINCQTNLKDQSRSSESNLIRTYTTRKLSSRFRRNTSLKPAKKGAGAGANANPAGGGAGTPLGSSPVTNSFFANFISNQGSNAASASSFTNSSTTQQHPHLVGGDATNNTSQLNHTQTSPSTCVIGGGTNGGTTAASNNNFNISFPSALVGALRGGGTSSSNHNSSSSNTATAAGIDGYSSSCDGGANVCGGSDEFSTSISSSISTLLTTGPAYLTNCVSIDRIKRYQECKLMVQLPTHGFDRLEWIAYHTTFLIRFVGMFWLSNGLSQQCQCANLTAPHNFCFTLIDERTGKKIAPTKQNNSAANNCSGAAGGAHNNGGNGGGGNSNGNDAKCLIENSLRNMEKILNNEDLFPSKYGNQFNNDFENLAKRCCRSMYYILSHIFHAHHSALCEKEKEKKSSPSAPPTKETKEKSKETTKEKQQQAEGGRRSSSSSPCSSSSSSSSPYSFSSTSSAAALVDLFSYLITFIRQFSLIDKKDLVATEHIELCLRQGQDRL